MGDFIDSITANTLGLGLSNLKLERLAGQKPSETNIRAEMNIVIVSIQRSNEEIIFNPSGETTIEAGDMLIAIGQAESLMKLTAMAK